MSWKEETCVDCDFAMESKAGDERILECRHGPPSQKEKASRLYLDGYSWVGWLAESKEFLSFSDACSKYKKGKNHLEDK